MTMRLHKYIAHCGVASRRKAEGLILEGKVEVNGEIISELGVQVDPGKDTIVVDGRRLRKERKIYIALHKPRGYVTTSSDDLERKTVLDLIEGIEERIYPVGRLDRESEGLLVLTNDGELANYLTHPRCGVRKVYRVTVDGHVTDETLSKIRDGIRVGGRKIVPKRLRMLHRSNKSSRIEIEIGEGLNREVRRIFAAVDHEARKLIRIQVGPLSLEGLPRGMARKLTDRELDQLRQGMQAAGFDSEEPLLSNPHAPSRSKPRQSRGRGRGRGRGRSSQASSGPRRRVKTSKRGRGGSGRKPGSKTQNSRRKGGQ
ncbi:MAG: pseudouridine synthase [Planctomycetota bacterium]